MTTPNNGDHPSLRDRLRRGKLESPGERYPRITPLELRKALAARKMSRAALSRLVGISDRMACFICSGRERPSVPLSRRIRETLRMPIPKAMKAAKENPSDLWTYFHHTFKPLRLAHRRPVYIEQFTSAISCLYHVLGNEPSRLTIGAITEANIQAMKEILLSAGYAPITVSKYGYLLRAVLRDARGSEAFPRRNGRWQRDHGEHAPVDAPGTIWNFYLHRFQPSLIGCCTGYLSQLESAVRMFCRFAKNGAFPLAELSDEKLLEFAQDGLSRGRSRDTVKDQVAIIQRIWRLAVRKKLLTAMPERLALKSVSRQPQAWSMAQMGRLLEACHQTPGWIGCIPAAAFWFAVVMVTYDTGLRLRSVFSIRQGDLDRESGWLTVPAENMKNRKEQRFFLSHDTLAAIERIWEPQRPELFPWPYFKHDVSARFRKVVVRAGLKFSKKDGLHKIRRTSATHLAALVGIGEASRHLGHSDVSVTMRYIDPTMMPTIRAGEILPRPVMPTPRAAEGGVA